MCTLQYFNISVCAYGNANTNRRRTEILDTKKFSRKFSKKKKIQENFRHKKIFRHMRKNYFPKNKIFSVFLCLFCYRRNLVFNFVAKNKFVVFFIWWLFFFFFFISKETFDKKYPSKTATRYRFNSATSGYKQEETESPESWICVPFDGVTKSKLFPCVCVSVFFCCWYFCRVEFCRITSCTGWYTANWTLLKILHLFYREEFYSKCCIR